MERDWVRLGAELRAAREALGPTQAQMGATIGVGRDAIRNIEAGESRRLTNTIREYGRAVGWSAGSVADVLAGREPTQELKAEPVPTGVPDNPNVENGPAYASGMPARITLELSDGVVLDAEVIDLSAPGSTGKLVMVAKTGASDASDEEKRATLLRWARIQRRIRAIVDEELTDP